MKDCTRLAPFVPQLLDRFELSNDATRVELSSCDSRDEGLVE